MGTGELSADRTEEIEVEAMRNVPGSSDLQRMKNGSIPNAIAIDFPDGGVLGMKVSRDRSTSNDSNFGGKVGVHG